MRLPSIVLSLSLLATSVAITGCPWDLFPVTGQTPPPGDPTKQFNVDTEKQELNALIDSESVRPYFDPSKLINDGVGIFASEDAGDLLPRRWGRSYPKAVQATGTRTVDQMAIDFRTDADRLLTAEATFSVSRSARFVADFAWQKRLVTKSYNEAAQRTARFVKQNGKWRLVSLSPMTLGIAPAGKVGLDLVKLKVAGSPSLLVRDGQLLDSTEAPRVLQGQAATVEAHATYSGASSETPPYYLFLSLPPGRDRVRLHDDGRDGDAVKDDGVYSTSFNFPATTGIHHLVIDAVTSTTFTDLGGNSYDASLWGISYLVQGGDAQ